MLRSERTLGLFTTDAALVVQSWDGWMARATGIPAGEACGRPLATLVPDFEARGFRARFRRVLEEGVVEVLSPIFHRPLVPCPPSACFDRMQQHVTLAPLRHETRIVGVLVTVEDVTARLEAERAY
jgi:PAS domain-containing protein